jgi:hypothetical protein
LPLLYLLYPVSPFTFIILCSIISSTSYSWASIWLWFKTNYKCVLIIESITYTTINKYLTSMINWKSNAKLFHKNWKIILVYKIWIINHYIHEPKCILKILLFSMKRLSYWRMINNTLIKEYKLQYCGAFIEYSCCIRL